MVIMKKLIALLVCLALCAPVTARADEAGQGSVLTAVEAKLSPLCKGAILIEQSTGEVLFEQNADEKMPIASVTKVMTLLLVCEAIDNGTLGLSDMVTVSDNAASMGGSQAYMEPGEQLSADDMLKAVVVSSCNDGAVALAEHIAGSEEGFVSLMNSRAAELGLSDICFVNPTGLDDDECHVLSARDVAVISRELLKHDVIRNYTTIWMDTIRNGAFGLSNTNKLIRFYNGATGLKTGSTSKAKYCLSASAKRDGMELIAVVLGADSSDNRFSSAKMLLDFGFANYAVYRPETEIPQSLNVLGGDKKTVTPKLSFEGILVEKTALPGMKCEVELPDELYAPIEEGAEIGRVVCRSGDDTVSETPIICTEGVRRLGFSDYLILLVKNLFLCG